MQVARTAWIASSTALLVALVVNAFAKTEFAPITTSAFGDDLVFEGGFENNRPVANAGLDRTTLINLTTTLDGLGTDPDGDTVTFDWSVQSQPVGANVSLSNPTSAAPSFTPSVLGAYDFQLIVSDGRLFSIPDAVTVTATAQVLPPVANAGPAQIVARNTTVQLDGSGSSDPQAGPLTYSWTVEAQPDGSNVMLQNPSSVTPSFTASIAGLYRLQLVVNNGELPSAPATVEVVALPPAPTAVAPPLPPTETTSTAAASTFLYSGADPIQINVAPGAIEAQRGGVIRGRVINREGVGIAGVTVQVLGRPELGRSLSQVDGEFDFAVNGGEQVVLEFSRDGLLTVQRRASTDWNGQRGLDRLVMIAPDPNAQRISLGRNALAQIISASVSRDQDGERRARLFIPPASEMRVQYADGRGSEALLGATLRITEYTVGTLGPITMPGELPGTTSYTYAADITIDETLAPDAERVQFNEPLPLYVDNDGFMDFPVGGVVPLGYYDRGRAEWVPSPNGRVLKVLSIAAGRAVLDVEGVGVAATPAQLAELGITDAELVAIAGQFAENESFWRSPIPFLQVRGGQASTPWDCNWPRVPPAGAQPPQLPPAKSGNEPPRNQDGEDAGDDAPGEGACKGGSVIQCQRQVMMKSLPITGTPFALHYSTERTPGWLANNSVQIPVTGATVPTAATGAEIEIQIAGRTVKQALTLSANQNFPFVWDGRDAYDRVVNGAQELRARVGYIYPALNAQPGQFQQAFSTLTGVPITGNRARQDITLWQEHRLQIGAPIVSAVFGIGGFSLTPHHFYDPVRRTLYQGNGQIREPNAQTSDFNVRNLAGSTAGFAGDGSAAQNARLNNPRGIAVGPDGSIYIADAFNHRIRRISPAGLISTVAGSAFDGFGGDGGPATAARLSVPADVVLDREGNLYIADSYNHRVRRVDRSGMITTVAGTGVEGYAGDGGNALSANMAFPSGLAFGPFGDLYIADTFNHRIRRIGADGVITTTAGNGVPGDAGDGSAAIEASLQFPLDLDVSADGEQFIVDNVSHRIRKVNIGGLISTVAGNGTQGTAAGVNGDGGPATSAQLNFPRGVTVLPDGTLLIADGSSRRVRAVRSDGTIVRFAGGGTLTADGSPGPSFQLQFPTSTALMPDGRVLISDTGTHRIRSAARFLPQFSVGDIAIASPKGEELYRFNANGRHLETRDTLTGSLRYRFTYDSAGRLSTVEDGDGDITTIERNASGVPTAIISEDNLRTSLTLSNGLLVEVMNPNNERVQIEYQAGGLINRYVDARNFDSTYGYDASGRLTNSTNAAKGGLTLSRTDAGVQSSVSVGTTLNRITGYSISSQTSGDQARQTTFPDNTSTQVAVSRDGLHTTTQADGTVIHSRSAPDPRFDLQSGYSATNTTATGGRTLTVLSQRNLTLSDPSDPLSLTSFTEQGSVNGRPTLSSYDAATRTWTTISPAGRITRTVIDFQGRPTKQQVTGLADVDITYDNRGRLTSTRTGTGADERETTYVYSPQGFLQTMTDPISRSMSFVRDPVGRTLEAIRPDKLKTEFTYDASGNMATLKPAGRPAHSFVFTPVDLLETYTPPAVSGSGSTASTYSYNDDKQLIEVIRPDGEDIDYTYDSAGRLSTQAINRGSYSMSYNAASGKLTGMNAPGGINLAYTYAGALMTQTQWTGPTAGRVGFAYDNDFRITSISVNAENAIAMGYDADSLLTSAGALTLTYRADNGLFSSSTIGTVSDSYSYSAFAEPLSYGVTQAGNPLYSESYTRDKLGRITRKIEVIGGVTRTLDYEYDVMGRLHQVKTDDQVTATYTYDPNGNRLARVAGAQSTAYTYDDQDRLLSAGTTAYTYTAAGELRTITNGSGVTTFTHDELSNLLSVELPDSRTISYRIDGQNRRIGKLVNGTAVQGFLYQDQLRIVAELNGTNAVVNRFIYADKSQVPAYMMKGGQAFRFVTDQVGSVRMLVNTATGAIAQRIDYDEFGNVTADTSPGFQPFGFAGGLWDRDTGLVRFGARDYDPRAGRWVSKDPGGFEDGDNLYSYVSSDPIGYVDPTGEFAFLAPLVPIAIRFATAAALDFSFQMGMNGFDVNKVSIWDLGVAGAVGVFSPGIKSIGRAINPAKEAIRHATKAIGSSGSKRAYHIKRMGTKSFQIRGASEGYLAWLAVKKVYQSLDDLWDKETQLTKCDQQDQ